MVHNNIPRPRVACEVSVERVVAARSADKAVALESATEQSLPTGALVPALQQANLASRQAVVDALRDSLSVVAGRWMCASVRSSFSAAPKKNGPSML